MCKQTPKCCDNQGRQEAFLTVIVPVRNEANSIEQTLTQLVEQDYDPEQFEILVIDGQSTDNTPELVARLAATHKNIRLLSNPRRLSSAARNIGIQNAKGDMVVVVDGHCDLDGNDYLRKLADAFDRSGADCIGRPQPLDVPGASTLQRAIATARSSRLGHHPDSHIYSSEEGFVPAKSVAVAYRRSVFERVGMFDENFDACEDVEFNHRIDQAGLRCFFTPEVAVRYAPRASLGGLFRQLTRYGRGRIRLLRKHPETFSLRTLTPALFVVGLIVGLPLSLASSWLLFAYVAVLGLYAAILFFGGLWISFRHGDGRLFSRLPVILLTIHVASGMGMLVELFQPARGRRG